MFDTELNTQFSIDFAKTQKQKIKIFTIIVTNKTNNITILKKSFNDFNKAQQFYDCADLWYGDKHKIEFNTITK
jgi:hypothetical protein